VLGTGPDQLDGDRPLLQLGIDSLMAIELRNWIEGELEINLPIVELMRSPSMSHLAGLLAEEFGTRVEAPSSGSSPDGSANIQANGHASVYPVDGDAPGALPADVEEMTVEQVDTLLAALLDETRLGPRR
jgi:acyl carrier protein